MQQQPVAPWGEVIATDRYLGTASLKVTPPERGAARLLATPAAIRERPKLGEYRYLRFAWKKQGGAQIALQIGHDGRLGPSDPKETAPGKSFRYDACAGPLSFGSAVRLAPDAPRVWTDYTRDLYADFRRLTVPAHRGVDGLVQVVRDFDGAGIKIDDIALRRPTLDDVFLSLTGHAVERAEADEDGTSAAAPAAAGRTT